MTERDAASAQAEVTINADPDTVYHLITDLPTLASLAEENEAMEWRKGDKVSPGAVFKGHNRNGSHRWSTTCTVTEAEPGRVFAFDVRYAVLPIARWATTSSPPKAVAAGSPSEPGIAGPAGSARPHGSAREFATATRPTPNTSSSPWRG